MVGARHFFARGGGQRREKEVEWERLVRWWQEKPKQAQDRQDGEGLIFREGKKGKKEKVEQPCQTRTTSKSKVEHIIGEMNAWNASHPKATFLQIEEKARALVSQLEAHLIQESRLRAGKR